MISNQRSRSNWKKREGDFLRISFKTIKMEKPLLQTLKRNNFILSCRVKQKAASLMITRKCQWFQWKSKINNRNWKIRKGVCLLLKTTSNKARILYLRTHIFLNQHLILKVQACKRLKIDLKLTKDSVWVKSDKVDTKLSWMFKGFTREYSCFSQKKIKLTK